MEFIEYIWLGKPLWMWLAFLATVVTLLALDLGVLHKQQREIGVSESLVLSAVYIGLGLLFGAWVWWYSRLDCDESALHMLIAEL